jgi:glutaredoxin
MQTNFSADPSNGVTSSPLTRGLLALVCGWLVLGSGNLQAQTVYRIVGPDGQVTFSDKPPVTPSGKVTPMDNALPATAPVAPALPYALRQVVDKYPVTLYSSSNCAPCDSGRKLLAARGVPFSEKTITTAQDAEALQKLSGSNSLPFLTIGAQPASGFSASEWTQYLNAAGYPESSRLPTNYRQAPAAPLVAPDKPATPEASTTAPAEVSLPPVTAPPSSPSNPAGIQF